MRLFLTVNGKVWRERYHGLVENYEVTNCIACGILGPVRPSNLKKKSVINSWKVSGTLMKFLLSWVSLGSVTINRQQISLLLCLLLKETDVEPWQAGLPTNMHRNENAEWMSLPNGRPKWGMGKVKHWSDPSSGASYQVIRLLIFVIYIPFLKIHFYRKQYT